MINLSATQKQSGRNTGASSGMLAQPRRCLHLRHDDHDALDEEDGAWRDRAVAAIVEGEPCIDVANGRILCGELLQTPNGEQALLFVSFAWIDGDLLPIDTCLMPLEVLVDAIDRDRIVFVGGVK